jgi:hypothetical protein
MPAPAVAGESLLLRVRRHAGTLDGGEVWTGADAAHGFINRRGESATWLEAQSLVPPDSGAFFFPEDWRALPR